MSHASGSYPAPQSAAPKLTGTEWLICVMAAIGFLFDTYELLMAPLVGPAALQEFFPDAKPGDPTLERWNGFLLYIPALMGGLFGLLGGYLTDRFGRRRMLVFSILLYALSAFTAGFSTSVYMLLALRCTTMIGVCVEFVAAVAWLAELFPHPATRERVLGYTQLFGSFGGLLVAVINKLLTANIVGWGLPTIGGGELPGDVWRYTLISGLLPAIPLLAIRPFLPESPKWQEKKAAGTLKRPSFAALFSPELRRVTIVTGILFACTLGIAFGALQHGPRIARQHAAGQKLPKEQQEAASGTIQLYQEMGGLAGRLGLALLLLRVASRRTLLRMFVIPAMIVVPLAFYLPASGNMEWFKWGIALAGFFAIAQLSFWGNYLPTMYPVHLRGTGESFAANVGGRMVGTFAAMLTTTLSPMMAAQGPPGPAKGSAQLAAAAAIVAGAVCFISFIASFWLPEPKPGAHDE